jgi:hypothetical protein
MENNKKVPGYTIDKDGKLWLHSTEAKRALYGSEVGDLSPEDFQENVEDIKDGNEIAFLDDTNTETLLQLAITILSDLKVKYKLERNIGYYTLKYGK